MEKSSYLSTLRKSSPDSPASDFPKVSPPTFSIPIYNLLILWYLGEDHCNFIFLNNYLDSYLIVGDLFRVRERGTTHDTNTNLALWHQNPSIMVRPIKDYVQRAQQLFYCCEEISDQDIQKRASEEFLKFNLWASNLGVFAARHASLEYRLRTAPKVRMDIDWNLAIVCSRLLTTLKGTTDLSEEELCQFVHGSQFDSRKFGLVLLQNSISDDEPRIRELGLVADAISTLHKLSLAIRKASNPSFLAKVPLLGFDKGFTLIGRLEMDEQSETNIKITKKTSIQPAQFEITSAFENFIREVLVRRWFRRDEGSEEELDSRQRKYRQVLLDRCVEMVTTRRRQLTYFQTQGQLALKNVGKITSTTSEPSYPNAAITQPGGNRLPPIAPKSAGEHHSLYECSNTSSSSTADSSSSNSSELDLETISSEASTIAEDGFRNGGPFEVPPRPKLEANEKEKPCPYCYFVLPADTFTEQNRWERHLLEDLKPYICLFEGCRQRGKSYSSFKDWQAHLNLPHYEPWRCPLHPDDLDGEPLFDGVLNFEDHLITSHPYLGHLIATYLIRDSTKLAVLPLWCFLCFEKHSSVSELQTHMAKHFESMSLLALPWRDDIEEEKAMAIASNQNQIKK
ncbi:hypothetical protein NHQ30_008855 [Ciborinia camelliae]|nr:hypothetical protein NHQ30_008855 [Ciborinia camelliae]